MNLCGNLVGDDTRLFMGLDWAGGTEDGRVPLQLLMMLQVLPLLCIPLGTGEVRGGEEEEGAVEEDWEGGRVGGEWFM